MIEAINLMKFLMGNLLCLIYSSWIGLRILIDFVMKRDTKFWEVKPRPNKPKVLTSNEFGEHKFMTVNVRLIFIQCKHAIIKFFHFLFQGNQLALR